MTRDSTIRQSLTHWHSGTERKKASALSVPLCLCVRFLLAWLLLCACASRAGAQPELPAEDKALREKWQQVYQKIAGTIEMRRGDMALALEKSPLLFYTNPVRTHQQHGTIFLWTKNGRPTVFGSIWSAVNRNDASIRFVTHEFHSLADTPDVSGRQEGVTIWSSGEAGIAWQSLANSPAPAATRTARLVQLRQLARRLSARITSEEATDLRLMPNPLYRYPEQPAAALDGGLFAFCLTTDPELIVLLEADTSAKSPAYRVAFARFGNQAMELKDGDKQLWSCDRGEMGRAEGKYYLRWRAEEMPAKP
jgi:hypothetical protein